MRIAIGADHAGFAQKEMLKAYLEQQGHEVEDVGCYSEQRCDYPDIAQAVARLVAQGDALRGVLVCGTGIGMAIAANKVAGVRAANVTSEEFAVLCREHNDANVVTLSGRFVSEDDNRHILDAFLATEFAEGRHAQRVAKIGAISNAQ